MNEVLSQLIENIQLVLAIADEYTQLCCTENVNLDNQIAFRHIYRMLYYDFTNNQTDLVSSLRLLDYILVPEIYKHKLKIKVMGTQIVTSINCHERLWENALMENVSNTKVHGLLEQLSMMPVELRRLIDFTKVDKD